MMEKEKLTDRFVASRKPAPAGKRMLYADAIVPGFALRVTDRGHKSFIVGFRPPGSKHFVRHKLGDARIMSLAEARTRAKEWLQALADGKDPKRSRATETPNRFTDVAERYIAVRTPSQRTGARSAREIRKEL